MKRGTPDHPKTARLAAALGIPKPHAVGLLEMLWHFTGRFAPRGDIGRYPDSDIAKAVGWDGDPGNLIQALLQEGWIDSDKAYRLLIHDWPAHCEQAVRKYLARNKLRFARKSGRRPDAVHPAPSGPPLPLPLPEPEPTDTSPSAFGLGAEPPPADRPGKGLARGGWVGRVLDLWPGAIPGGRVGKALAKCVERHGEAATLDGLRRWLAAGNARFGPEVFARDCDVWVNGGGPARAPGKPTAAEVTGGAVREILAEERAMKARGEG